jgi:DNA-binding GntR family transcriptional regulator
MKRIEAVAAPVREQTVAIVREAIVSGQFVPGQRLIEKDLCDTLGVSRGSVREALRQLEAEQLIQNLPNRGPIVAKLTPRDILDICQVRSALEGMAVKLFVQNANEVHIARLEAGLEAIDRAFTAGDLNLTVHAKSAFYQAFYEGSGNALITSVLRSLDARINLVRRLVFVSGESSGGIVQFRALVDALKRQDAKAATAVCEELLDAAVEVATKMIEAEESRAAE